MKNLFAIAVAILSLTTSFAQVSENPFRRKQTINFEIPKGILDPNYLLDRENDVLIGVGHTRKYKKLNLFQVDPYRGDMREIVELDLKSFKHGRNDAWYWKDLSFSKRPIVVENGIATLFLLSYDKKSRTKTVLGLDIDLNSGAYRRPVPYWSQELDRKSTGLTKYDYNEEKKQLVFYSTMSEEDGDRAIVSVGIVNLGGDLVWKKTVDMETENEFLTFHSIDLLDNGEVVLTMEEEKMEANGTPRLVLYFHKFSSDGKELKTTSRVQELMGEIAAFARTFVTREMDSGNLLISGTYGSSERGTFAGMFTFTIDRTLWECSEVNIMPLSDDVWNRLSENHRDIPDRKSTEGFKDMYMDTKWFKATKSGGYFHVIENHYGRWVQTSDGAGGTSTYWESFANDVVVTKLDEQGVPEWMEVVPKEQHMSSKTKYLSMNGTKVVELNDGIGLLYIDHPLNQSRWPEDVKKPFIGMKGQLVLVRVNQDGQMDYQSVLPKEWKEVPIYLNGAQYYRGAEEEWLIFSDPDRGKKGGFILMKE